MTEMERSLQAAETCEMTAARVDTNARLTYYAAAA